MNVGLEGLFFTFAVGFGGRMDLALCGFYDMVLIKELLCFGVLGVCCCFLIMV